MRLTDLIELFVERETNPPRPHEPSFDGERKDSSSKDTSSRDTSSLADIARILRELDGQYEVDREAGPQQPPRPGEQVLRS